MSRELPRISIVTICFNQAPFLQECVRSVLAQDAGGIEYIVVDPGSTDGSRDVLARHADHIDRLLLEPDHGPADGLNKGFAAATGQIFGYINADDRLAPGALRYVADYFASRPGTDVLCGAIRIIDREGRAAIRARTADRFDLARYAAGICTVGQQATFFRRQVFHRAGGFNAKNHITWDGELLVDMALAGARFETSRRVLGDFRIYPGSITGSRDSRERSRQEQQRVSAKIRAHGVPLYSSAGQTLHRALYKANALRHLG